MSAPRKTHALSPAAAGLAWGLTAAAIWTVYSVLARLGIKSGLTPFDMTLLRFMPGALVMLPFVWRWGWRDMAGLGWRRGLALAALSGPVFSLLMMTGFAHAPYEGQHHQRTGHEAQQRHVERGHPRLDAKARQHRIEGPDRRGSQPPSQAGSGRRQGVGLARGGHAPQ